MHFNSVIFVHFLQYMVLIIWTASNRLQNVHVQDTDTGTILVATCVIKGMGDSRGLHSEQNEESDHQTEETHGFGQGESQDGVGEQLLLQGWVPGNTRQTQ